MATVSDFFFAPYEKPSERRRHAALAHGLYHGSRIQPRDPAPGETVTLAFTSNAALPLERVAVYYTTDGTTPEGARGEAQHGTVALAEPGPIGHDAQLEAAVCEWHARIPAQPSGALVRYRADGWSEHAPHVHRYADALDPVGPPPPQHGRIFAYSVDAFHAPSWFRDAVIYHVYVDRFATAHDEPPLRDPGTITGFFGGTLRGVLENLDYIVALGANCLWLSPVFESPSAHGYNPSSYTHVARRYGTSEDLQRLIAEAHRRGMRVLLDFVANHTSDEHPLFLEALSNPAGPAGAFYSFGQGRLGYRAYMDVPNMPELDTGLPEVERYLADAALRWLNDFGADGLRLDFAAGPTHAFWAVFQRKVKRMFPEALTIGEVTDTPEGLTVYAGRMDAVMDFPLTGLLRQVFAQRTAAVSDLLAFLSERAHSATDGLERATLLNNHDMHRFLWLAGGDVARLRLAATCELTLPGTPVIYYGTEVGLTQDGDAHEENAYARGPMLWGDRQNRDLLEHYQHLLALRHAHPALRYGSLVPLPVEVSRGAPTQVGAYLRQHQGEQVIVVLNNSDAGVQMHITVPAGPMGAPLDTLLALEGSDVRMGQTTVELKLPPLGAVVLGTR